MIKKLFRKKKDIEIYIPKRKTIIQGIKYYTKIS